jgi:uncharacterized protein YgbK (DUF1537 family)
MRALGVPLRVLRPGPAERAACVAELAADLAARGFAAMLCADYPGAPEDALAAMEDVVGTLASAAPVSALFATGGETARALCRRLGGASLELRAEIEPGVTAARMTSPGGARLIIAKPGGYGNAQTLVRAREWLSVRMAV